MALGANNIEELIIKKLLETVKNKCLEDLGFVTDVESVEKIEQGEIIQNNGSVKFKVTFIANMIEPKIGEIIEGTVVSIIQDGIFIQNIPFEIFVPNHYLKDVPYENDKISVKLIHYQIKDDHINCIGELINKN